MKRFLIMCLVGFGAVGGAMPIIGATKTDDDYLVPPNEEHGIDVAYRHLWQRKLFVTPGDVARFVWLPGITGEEHAVSIYRAAGKQNAFPGDYWLTVTQASASLWDSVPKPGGRKAVNPRTITIDRCDLPLAEPTAQGIRNVWLAILRQTRPGPVQKRITLDSTTQIFSAKDASGKILIGEFSNEPAKRTLALLDIANSLIELCNVPEARRPQKIRKIDKKCADLLNLLRFSEPKR